MKKALLFVLTALLIAVNGFGQNIDDFRDRSFVRYGKNVVIRFNFNRTISVNGKIAENERWEFYNGGLELFRNGTWYGSITRVKCPSKISQICISDSKGNIYYWSTEVEPEE